MVSEEDHVYAYTVLPSVYLCHGWRIRISSYACWIGMATGRIWGRFCKTRPRPAANIRKPVPAPAPCGFSLFWTRPCPVGTRPVGKKPAEGLVHSFGLQPIKKKENLIHLKHIHNHSFQKSSIFKKEEKQNSKVAFQNKDRKVYIFVYDPYCKINKQKRGILQKK